jgi:excinuclease UvrABC nuclease subunit
MVCREIREFDTALGEEWFAALPAAPAVFVLRARAEGGEPYVSKTANLRRRLERLLGAPKDQGQSRRLSLRERVRGVEWSEVGGDFEAGFALYRLLREEFPAGYAARMHLRAAPLLHLLRQNAYPRLAVSTKLRSVRAGDEYFGPFASRAEAEQFASDSLDFFLLRRCTEELRPDPGFPGCVYSEMKMCLAPCFKGCSDERYAEEAGSVQRYLESGGRSLVVEIGRARDEASERLEFEQAAAAHARLEKLKTVQARRAEIVHRIDRLNGVLLQPSRRTNEVGLFRIAGGMLSGPVALKVGMQDAGIQDVGMRDVSARGESRSMEARIVELLGTCEASRPASAQEWMEHLAMLKRWYYRTSRVGEIFFEDEKGTLPMRRVVRAVGRVLKGEKAVGDLSETAKDYWVYRAKDAGI